MDADEVARRLVEAEQLAEARRFDEASEVLGSVIAADPTCHDALYSRGHCRLARGEYDAAREDFVAAVAACPKRAPYYLGSLAMVCYATGRHVEGIEVVTRALEDRDVLPDETIARLLYNRAMCHRALGDDTRFREDWMAAREFDPDGRLDPAG